MKLKKIILGICAIAIMMVTTSCEEDSSIGSSLKQNEVTIVEDSSFTIAGKSALSPQLDSKTITQMLGKLHVPEYGDLQCTFVTQLMPAQALSIPDSITAEDVDSIRLRFRLSNGAFTGDSLSPQRLRIYRLTKQLPADIDNNFDVTGYYDTSFPLGEKSYTASALGMLDTIFKSPSRSIWVRLPKAFALETFNAYRNHPEIFTDPNRFLEYFPGLYVEQSFGKGLIVNITNTELVTYYHHIQKVSIVENGVGVTKDSVMMDSTTLFSVSPEIISSNNIKVRFADSLRQRIDAGEPILLSPCGYNVEIDFPTKQILESLINSDYNMAVINNLVFSIPVAEIKNNYGIKPPTYLLMVKTKDLKTFFAENKVPDDVTSFWASYDSDKGIYTFTSMRQYIVDLRQSGKEITPEDYQFTIVPVSISTEETLNQSIVVSDCSPYIAHPSMCSLKLDEAKVKFTYSKQVIK